jgi:DNA-binding transcriptional LysR family regulator
MRGGATALAVAILPPVVKRFSELYSRFVLFVDELPTQASQRAALQDRKCDVTPSKAWTSDQVSMTGLL